MSVNKSREVVTLRWSPLPPAQGGNCPVSLTTNDSGGRHDQIDRALRRGGNLLADHLAVVHDRYDPDPIIDDPKLRHKRPGKGQIRLTAANHATIRGGGRSARYDEIHVFDTSEISGTNPVTKLLHAIEGRGERLILVIHQAAVEQDESSAESKRRDDQSLPSSQSMKAKLSKAIVRHHENGLRPCPFALRENLSIGSRPIGEVGHELTKVEIES